MGMVKRFEVYLVDLNPTIGSEIYKTSPALIVSPDEMNKHLRTVIIAPMTTKGYLLPSRVSCKFQGKQGLIVLDQIRTVDKERLIKRLGKIEDDFAEKALEILQTMFEK